jgi:hypothetical protein
MKKMYAYFLALLMMSVLVLAIEGSNGKPADSGAIGPSGERSTLEANPSPDTGSVPIVGNDRDEHGCIPSAGYSWCEEKQKCIRPWEEKCLENSSAVGSANSQEVRARVEEKLQSREQELTQEMAGKGDKEQQVLRNQNQVRLAVHALLEMKDEIGGIGQNVSAIARQFNNSVQATIRAEERIQNRSSFSRFFAGGDKKAADEIEKEVKANQENILELKQLKDQCNCTQEAKDLMQQQVQSMESEQARLDALAQKELKSKGLFGWIWK